MRRTLTCFTADDRHSTQTLAFWIDEDLKDSYHQLVIDLGVSISCCKLLLGRINDMIDELNEGDDGDLGRISKLRLAFSSNNIDRIQKALEQQTAALTLLLTACNWYVVISSAVV